MRLARANALTLAAALFMSRGLFAQADSLPLPLAGLHTFTLTLFPVERRFALPDALELPAATTRAVKALYVNAWVFSSRKLAGLIQLADSTEINAFVVDVKDDTGCLLYPSAVETALAIGASACARTRDAKAKLDSIRAHGIYPIARIVVAKDPLLAERKPGWSVKDVTTGGLWRDRIGIAWVDAFNDSVWVYAAQLAEEAVRMGFAEVQFDYVRFPDEPKQKLATALFAARDGRSERESVAEHVRFLTDRLKPLGVPVTFDIFGLTASATGDLGIGQVWEDFSSVADVVLPMVYPSHYRPGAFGYQHPNAEPYEVVRHALREALERSQGDGVAAIRPYLQAFTLGRRLPRYTPYEIREEIRAAEELGITSWVLWNPRSVYQRESLRPYPAVERAATLSEGSP